MLFRSDVSGMSVLSGLRASVESFLCFPKTHRTYVALRITHATLTAQHGRW